MKKKSKSDIFFYIVMLFAFSMPLSRAAVSLFVILIPLFWLYKIDFTKLLHNLKTNKVLLVWIIFIGYMLLSLVWLEEVSQSTIRELRLLLYYITLVAIATSFESKFTNQIINAFLLGMFVSEVISYGVFFELWSFKHATVQDPTPFMNHLDYSIFLAFGSILLLNKIFSTYQLKEKVLYILFFLSITGNLFITGGRTGQLSLLISFIVLSVIHFKMKVKTIFVALSLIILIFGTAYNVSSTFKKRISQATNDIEKMVSNEDYTTSLGIRVAYWIAGADIVKENLLFGVGIGGYKQAYNMILEEKNENYNREFMKNNTPHNQFLLILLNFGFIGLGIFLYFMYLFFKMPIKNNEIKELSILFGVVVFVSLVADTFLLDQFTLALFCLFGGLFMANVRNSEVFCEG